MRVKFNYSIRLCTHVSITENSKILLFTTSNGVYVVDMETPENAKKYYEDILVKGYCDVSNFEYGN